jgi:hypothetical protein
MSENITSRKLNGIVISRLITPSNQGVGIVIQFNSAVNSSDYTELSEELKMMGKESHHDPVHLPGELLYRLRFYILISKVMSAIHLTATFNE